MMSAISDLRYVLSEFGGELISLLLGLGLMIWITARTGAALKVTGVLILLASPVIGFGTSKLPLLPRQEPDVERATLLAFTGLLLIGFGSLVSSALTLVAEIRSLRVDQEMARDPTVISDHQNAAFDHLRRGLRR
jgi:hypothetical protein